MPRASRAEWEKRIGRWADSGLTAKEFAAEAGLKASALYYWRSQLSAPEREDSDSPDELSVQPVRSERTRFGKSEKRSATPSPRFVEVPIAAVSQAPVMLEVLLGDVRVRVPSGFDEATLARVVRALGVAR
jgi:transposase